MKKLNVVPPFYKEIQGRLHIPFKDNKFTVTFYYNDPIKAIRCFEGWYLPKKFPYFLCQRDDGYYGGTYEEVLKELER